ncbi:MAG: hypothetical protein F7C09_04020 [Aeropyrum sp.]|nr:hypothetical protein [Aeropyrum sp.]
MLVKEIEGSVRLMLLEDLRRLVRQAFVIDEKLSELGDEEDDLIDYVVLSAARRVIAEDIAEILDYLVDSESPEVEVGESGGAVIEEAVSHG